MCELFRLFVECDKEMRVHVRVVRVTLVVNIMPVLVVGNALVVTLVAGPYVFGHRLHVGSGADDGFMQDRVVGRRGVGAAIGKDVRLSAAP